MQGGSVIRMMEGILGKEVLTQVPVFVLYSSFILYNKII